MEDNLSLFVIERQSQFVKWKTTNVICNMEDDLIFSSSMEDTLNFFVNGDDLNILEWNGRRPHIFKVGGQPQFFRIEENFQVF